MLFKNLFLGLVGTAAVGGVGYGIYSSSQSSDEDKKDDELELKGKGDDEAEGGKKLSAPKVEGDVQNQESDNSDGNKTDNSLPPPPESPQ